MWIETVEDLPIPEFDNVTPHVGVWIETVSRYFKINFFQVTPHVGVWIETAWTQTPNPNRKSHLM